MNSDGLIKGVCLFTNLLENRAGYCLMMNIIGKLLAEIQIEGTENDAKLAH